MFFDWLFETKVINICVGVAIQPESSIKAGFHSVSIGSDWTFFQFVLSTPPDQKKVENTSTLYHPGCGSQVQTGTENWYRKPMRGFNFVPIRSDPMLIFWSGNRRLTGF